jgi:hypothetical protein
MLYSNGLLIVVLRSKIAKTRFRIAELACSIPAMPTVSIIVCAMTIAGCAGDPNQQAFNPIQHEAKAAVVRKAAPTYAYSGPRPHPELRDQRPDAALLAPQAVPDCQFKAAEGETVDADGLARLKLEYERKCYQDAEKAVRERLTLLQASFKKMQN